MLLAGRQTELVMVGVMEGLPLSPRLRTQELLKLHDRAAGPQLVVHRVPVGVMLAVLIVKLALVDGRRGILVCLKHTHAGCLWP